MCGEAWALVGLEHVVRKAAVLYKLKIRAKLCSRDRGVLRARRGYTVHHAGRNSLLLLLGAIRDAGRDLAEAIHLARVPGGFPRGMRVRGVKAGIELVGREGYCLRAAEPGGREVDGCR